MNKVESAAAYAFLIGFLIYFTRLREPSVDGPRMPVSEIRGYYIALVAITCIPWAMMSGNGVGGFLILSLIPIGAADIAYWAAIGLHSKLGPLSPPDNVAAAYWSFHRDRVGCSIAIIAALALFLVMGITGTFESE